MRLGIICENSIEAIEIIGQELKKGNSLYIINKNSPIELLIEELNKLKIKTIYLPKDYTYFEKLSQNNNLIVYDSKKIGWFSSAILLDYNYSKSQNEAIILASSGTTNKRKLISLSHNAINLNAEKIYLNYSLNLSKECCIIKNFAHSSTLIGEIIVALKFGIRCYIASQIYNGFQLYKNIVQSKASFVCLNPLLLDIFYDYLSINKSKSESLNNLKIIYVSGSMLTKEKEHYYKVIGNIKILNCYGLTELGPRVTMQNIECYFNGRSTAVGKPLKGVYVKINDTVGNGCGEILVKTDSIMNEYIGESFMNKSGQWIHTGDVGFIDENEELNVIGRLDEQLTINSINYNPINMEQFFIKNEIFDDCVIVKSKNNNFEELVCLYHNNYLDYYSIKQKLRLFYPEDIQPKSFIAVKRIIYNDSGKKIRNIWRYKNENSLLE